MLIDLRPALVVVDPAMMSAEADRVLLARVRAPDRRVVALGADVTLPERRLRPSGAYDAFVSRPARLAELVEALFAPT